MEEINMGFDCNFSARIPRNFDIYQTSDFDFSIFSRTLSGYDFALLNQRGKLHSQDILFPSFP